MITRNQRILAAQKIANFLFRIRNYFPKNQTDCFSLENVGCNLPCSFIIEQNGSAFIFETNLFLEYVCNSKPENPYVRRLLLPVEITRLKNRATKHPVRLPEPLPPPPQISQLLSRAVGGSTRHLPDEAWESMLSEIELEMIRVADLNPAINQELALENIFILSNLSPNYDAVRIQRLIMLFESAIPLWDVLAPVESLGPIPVPRLWH